VLEYFFFQAEDGIRDFHVTGVQTCALPISAVASARSMNPARTLAALTRATAETNAPWLGYSFCSSSSSNGWWVPNRKQNSSPERSGESRVGRESGKKNSG